MQSWSREIGPMLLATLADTFTEWAWWQRGRGYIKGRWRVDPYEVPTGAIEPGIGEIQTWFYCDRRVVPLPLPELGDVLTIAGQVWEVVQRDEDDLGELGFRLIKQELGLLLPDPDEEPDPWAGDWDDKQSLWDQRHQVPSGPSWWDVGVSGTGGRRAAGRPSRKADIEEAFRAAVRSGAIRPDMGIGEVVRLLRDRIPGDRRGLGDRTMRRTIGPLLQRYQGNG